MHNSTQAGRFNKASFNNKKLIKPNRQRKQREQAEAESRKQRIDTKTKLKTNCKGTRNTGRNSEEGSSTQDWGTDAI